MNHEKKVKIFDSFDELIKKIHERHEAMLSKMNRHQRRKYFAEGRRHKCQ
tara:strand:+ start:188 stop:337 length:150 start_codon:yes stop_codon:yes gene_type:complete